jgi:hypothetical protein
MLLAARHREWINVSRPGQETVPVEFSLKSSLLDGWLYTALFTNLSTNRSLHALCLILTQHQLARMAITEHRHPPDRPTPRRKNPHFTLHGAIGP